MKWVLWSFLFCTNVSLCQPVRINYPDKSPQLAYAAHRLQQSFKIKQFSPRGKSSVSVINLAVDSTRQNGDSYSIVPEPNQINITGGNGSGVIYGALTLAEQLRKGITLGQVRLQTGKPHLPFRAIKYDLPWDTYRHSYALDQHIETCRSIAYWEAFLDMMVENRFNVLTLWNLHPYTYMIRPKNFPEACPFDAAEMKRWQDLFHGICKLANERGIEIYLVPFNIFVSPQFARAHHVAMDNLEHHFFVNGDTSGIIRRYTRECVTQVLQEYPELTGFGLTFGEGMGGMTPQQREDWMKETIIAGMGDAGRKVKLIHRIPLSAGTGSGGSTSIETEQLTRGKIEKEARLDFIAAPVWADLKFNWSHAHSTPKLIKVHGGKLYDTYFKPTPDLYKITWTARNEDFFCLRWGVPEFVRQHLSVNDKDYLGGYMVGSECYIPAKDYFTKPGFRVNWKYAFERQWLFYMIWGRLLYDPSTPDSVFQAEFIRRYGKDGVNLLQASALAGKTPLRLASAFDCTWDFTLYSEGMMALDNVAKRVGYISVDRLINQPPLDPDYISVKDYVNGASSGKISPLMLADMLEEDCNKALGLVSKVNTSRSTALMYEVADIKTWANLGLHFAKKLRGAVALETYRRKGGEENKNKAIGFLEHALRLWDTVISITQPVYNDMPLVQYSEQNGVRSKENQHLKFHWRLIRADVAKDVAIARAARAGEE